jgi:ACS family sodium-dependent inorganic phosphate cotransporter
LNFGKNLKIKEFDWNSKEQGLVLSSFFYGYITSQILGGYLATRIGAARLFGSAILVTAIMTLLTPILAYQGIWPLVFVRAAQGVCQVKDH